MKHKGYIRDYDLVKILATIIEIRILDIHLCRQLQTDHPRLRDSRTGQEHRHQELASTKHSPRITTSSRSSARRTRKDISELESQGIKSTSRREIGRSMRNTDTFRGFSSPSTSKTSPTPACHTVSARKCESDNPSH